MRLEDQEAGVESACGGPSDEDLVVTVEPVSGDKRSAATSDFPEEISSQNKPAAGYR